MSNNNTPIINYTLLKDALYKNTLPPEESSNAHVPIVLEVDGVKILQNILLSSIIDGGSSGGELPSHVVLVDTTIEESDESKRLFKTYLTAYNYILSQDSTDPWTILLQSGVLKNNDDSIDNDVILSENIFVMGLGTIINSTIKSYSDDLSGISTIYNCTITNVDITSGINFNVLLKNCFLNAAILKTKGIIFLDSCEVIGNIEFNAEDYGKCNCFSTNFFKCAEIDYSNLKCINCFFEYIQPLSPSACFKTNIEQSRLNLSNCVFSGRFKLTYDDELVADPSHCEVLINNCTYFASTSKLNIDEEMTVNFSLPILPPDYSFKIIKEIDGEEVPENNNEEQIPT